MVIIITIIQNFNITKEVNILLFTNNDLTISKMSCFRKNYKYEKIYF